MKLAETLRLKCAKMGLGTSGTASVLFERLKAHEKKRSSILKGKPPSSKTAKGVVQPKKTSALRVSGSARPTTSTRSAVARSVAARRRSSPRRTGVASSRRSSLSMASLASIPSGSSLNTSRDITDPRAKDCITRGAVE